MALAYLIDPQNQFMTKSGTINVGGVLRVYDAATDDAAVTYCDFGGTENEEAIVLDNNGRAIVIADSDKAYRVEVYDRYGTLMWTTTPIWCMAGGGGVMLNVTEVISSDGSIDIDKTKVGSTTTFDLSIAPDNVRDLLEWAKCYNTVEEDGVVYPLFSEGTMQTFVGQGLEVVQDRFYHLTNKITVIPSGNGINYETLTVQLVHDDGQGTTVALCTHDFDIDNSVSDKVELEFSEDIIPDVDGFLFWRVTNSSPFENVSLDLQIHRIFSGINAVPRSIASRVWVEENISSKIDYSALEYNQQNLITGISGSAIASNSVDPNDFIPWSASGQFQPSGDYLDASASSMFQPSGQYIYESAFSSYSSTVDSSITSISSFVSGLTGTYIEQSASSMFQPSGNYLSSTDSSLFQPSGDYLDASASSLFQPSGSYLSSTDSSLFQPNGNYVSATDMSSYVPYSAVSGEDNTVTSINGSAIKGHDEYSGIYPVSVDNVNDTIAVDHTGLAVDNETLSAFVSGDSIVLKVIDGVFQPSANMTAYIPYSAIGTGEI